MKSTKNTLNVTATRRSETPELVAGSGGTSRPLIKYPQNTDVLRQASAANQGVGTTTVGGSSTQASTAGEIAGNVIVSLSRGREKPKLNTSKASEKEPIYENWPWDIVSDVEVADSNMDEYFCIGT